VTLRFLFDQHINGPAFQALRAQGVDVVHASEVGMARADDAAMLQWAQREGRIVVTRNYRDFVPLAEALAARRLPFPGVLLVTSSIAQSDVGAHVRALANWIAAAQQIGANPVQNGFGWLR
jgi:predicted nuclease of predicted toxin-antitoxin system